MAGRESRRLNSERGYLLISTLFLLVFASLFIQMVIKISGSHIIQLRQFSEAYQAKSALNMSENVLKMYIETNECLPEKGEVETSMGQVTLLKTKKDQYFLKLNMTNNKKYSKSVKVKPPAVPEGSEDIEEVIDDDNEIGNE